MLVKVFPFGYVIARESRLRLWNKENITHPFPNFSDTKGGFRYNPHTPKIISNTTFFITILYRGLKKYNIVIKESYLKYIIFEIYIL